MTPTLPPQVAQLPWATQAVSILTAVLGALGIVLTTVGVSVNNAASIETAIQYLVFGVLSVAGLAAHTHLHATNQTNQVNAQLYAPLNAPPAPSANSGATMPVPSGLVWNPPISNTPTGTWSTSTTTTPVPPPVLPPTQNP